MKIGFVPGYAIACATAFESIRRLATHTHGEPVITGIFVAGVSVIALSVLAYATGALLGVVTVFGSVLVNIGWWWADPLTAALIACGAIGVAVHMHARSE